MIMKAFAFTFALLFKIYRRSALKHGCLDIKGFSKKIFYIFYVWWDKSSINGNCLWVNSNIYIVDLKIAYASSKGLAIFIARPMFPLSSLKKENCFAQLQLVAPPLSLVAILLFATSPQFVNPNPCNTFDCHEYP